MRHWKTEVVASHVEMLSGRKKKDYEAQSAAEALEANAIAAAGPGDDDDPSFAASREASAADPLPVEAAA